MPYVDLDAQVGDLSGLSDPARCLSRLPSISGDLPPDARAFATDADHYDFRSGRCVKDLTLRSVRGAGTTDGTQLIIWTCDGGANQRWTLP